MGVRELVRNQVKPDFPDELLRVELVFTARKSLKTSECAPYFLYACDTRDA